MEATINLYPWVNPEFTNIKKITNNILDSLIDHRDECYELSKKLKSFPLDAVIHACLEYSKYPRPYSHKQRLEYLIDKCEHYMLYQDRKNESELNALENQSPEC